MATIVAMLLTAAAYTAPAQPAQAVMVCGSEQKVLGLLYNVFDQLPIFVGPVNDNMRFIITMNDRTGSWSLLSQVNGEVCILTGGGNAHLDKGV